MKLKKIVFLSLLMAARAGIAMDLTQADSTSISNDSITWSKELDGVIIKAQKQLIKQEIDRIAYDVQSDEESKTLTVMDMLRKVPMVTVGMLYPSLSLIVWVLSHRKQDLLYRC